MDFLGRAYRVTTRVLTLVVVEPLRLSALLTIIRRPFSGFALKIPAALPQKAEKLLPQTTKRPYTVPHTNYYILSSQITTRMELKGRIVIFSIVGCPHCMKAKNTLQELGLPYTNISLDDYPTVREWVKAKTGKSTVPQIFFNATYVGGNDDLQKVVEDKAAFEKLLDDVKNNEPPTEAPEIPDPSTAVEGGMSDFTCEPDEYAKLVAQLKESGLIKDQRKGLSMQKNVFKGKDFVDWVVKTKDLDRATAIDMGQALINKKFGLNLKHEETFRDDDTLYRLLEDDDSNALNRGEISDCEDIPAGKLSEEIRKLILKIYDAFLSKDGKQVNYAGIAGSDEFKKFCRLVAILQRADLSEMTRNEKLAFFINIYNAQVIHANVVAGPPQNLWQRYKFFNTQKYMIGGELYSLQDIENGVLRSNRKGVGMFTRPFGKSDPRLKIALTEHEPLIHFALVCGAKSCPPIKTYSADGIMDQLKLAAESFMDSDDAVQLDMQARRVKLSMIFKWYREDFGANDHQVVEYILKTMDEGEKKDELNELITQGNYRVSHLPYDWSVNSK